MAEKLQGKLNYTHQAMIDLILTNPCISTKELADTFGYTTNWVNRVTSSDAFLEMLHSRRKEIIDPGIVATVEERVRQMTFTSLDIINSRLANGTVTFEQAMEALALGTKCMGLGVGTQEVNNTSNFVVMIPHKAETNEEWSERYVESTAKTIEDAPTE